jgi:hypothetical protein
VAAVLGRGAVLSRRAMLGRGPMLGPWVCLQMDEFLYTD